MASNWLARGPGDNGCVQEGFNGQTPAVPAVATHRGELWCLWSDVAGDLYYAIGDNNTFATRVQFPDQGIPVMAELTGVLHSIIVKASGEMAHYVFEDDLQTWNPLSPLDPSIGFTAHSTPTFVAFHNKLMLVFIKDYTMYYSLWQQNPQQGLEEAAWTYPQEVSGISKVSGIPALFVLNGTLHVLCSSTSSNREILGFAYDSLSSVWNSCDDVSEGKAAVGVSATSYGDSAFLAFQENGEGDESHMIYISEYKDGKWHPQESVMGQASADPPQLAILNGRINCIFNANDESRGLRWYSRPLLDFSLSSWMANLSDETLLSNMTIPGTHDSCARSSIPFVRTQYLSITKQMEAGLRFLDLRLRVHADGQLYCYHGGVPINLPMYLKFDTVMKDIFTFFAQTNNTETVLISINNDDVSGKLPPSTFYTAVSAHISAHASRWLTANTTSTLGSARGKAVLLRRYAHDPAIPANEAIGIDLSGWLNNNPSFTLRTSTDVTVHLQDHWQYSTMQPLHALIESKLSYVSDMLSRASTGPQEEWYINFTSAVGDPVQKGEIAESHWIAVGAHSSIIGKFVTGMNVSLRRRYRWKEEGATATRYGVLAMDYPELPKESDLIAWLIGTNF